MHIPLDPALPFAQAARLWMESRTMPAGIRARYVSPRTLRDLNQYVRALNRKFATTPLDRIHIGLLREYQEERSERCCASKINQELRTLLRIMKRAQAWTPQLDECYEPLLEQQADTPRAMAPAEQNRFLEVAASRLEWQFVYHYSLLALGTTASNCEMRSLRLGDVNLFARVLQIRAEHAKNCYRVRTIPLHDEAHWAAARLVERAQSLGAGEPEHYLMPFRPKLGIWDLLRPMSDSGVRRSWDQVRKAAGVPCLRIHDLRHTAITRLAEAGVPIPVILSMAGHISQRMQQHYTAVSDEAKRQAVEAALRGGNYTIASGRLVERSAGAK